MGGKKDSKGFWKTPPHGEVLKTKSRKRMLNVKTILPERQRKEMAKEERISDSKGVHGVKKTKKKKKKKKEFLPGRSEKSTRAGDCEKR